MYVFRTVEDPRNCNERNFFSTQINNHLRPMETCTAFLTIAWNACIQSSVLQCMRMRMLHWKRLLNNSSGCVSKNTMDSYAIDRTYRTQRHVVMSSWFLRVTVRCSTNEGFDEAQNVSCRDLRLSSFKNKRDNNIQVQDRSGIKVRGCTSVTLSNS